MEKVAEHINEMQRIHEEYGAIFDHLFRQHQKSCKQVTGLFLSNKNDFSFSFVFLIRKRETLFKSRSFNMEHVKGDMWHNIITIPLVEICRISPTNGWHCRLHPIAKKHLVIVVVLLLSRMNLLFPLFPLFTYHFFFLYSDANC